MKKKRVSPVAKALEEAKTSPWVWVFVVLCLLLCAGTVVVIVLAFEEHESIPEDIDVVLVTSTDPNRNQRYLYQAKAVVQYMPWVRRIFVLNENQQGFDPALGVWFVSFVGPLDQAFEFMPVIPGIAGHALFLSDMTFPWRAVPKSYLFSCSTPRLFNVFRDAAEETFFSYALELPTMPCLVTDLNRLRASTSWQELVFREVTEERVVLNRGMNRDLMLMGSNTPNITLQLRALQNDPPVFATFHINPQQPVTDLAQANQTLSQFLGQTFS